MVRLPNSRSLRALKIKVQPMIDRFDVAVEVLDCLACCDIIHCLASQFRTRMLMMQMMPWANVERRNTVPLALLQANSSAI